MNIAFHRLVEAVQRSYRPPGYDECDQCGDELRLNDDLDEHEAGDIARAVLEELSQHHPHGIIKTTVAELLK